jgi:hypothetical protein
MKIPELVTFYLRAVERFRAHTGSRAKGALAEALNWADTIDLYLAKGPYGTLGTQRDPNWADSVEGEGGDLVRGFQYARNHVHHQWLNMVAVRLHAEASGRQPNDWIWHAPPAPKRAGRAKRDEYREAFERQMLGRSVLETLDRLAVVFWDRRRWEIQRSDVEQPGYPVRSTLPFDPGHDDSTS